MPKRVESAIEHMERLNAQLLVAGVKSDALRLEIDLHLKRMRLKPAAVKQEPAKKSRK
jgi:hypothetical protein